jgi:hypothetical protein
MLKNAIRNLFGNDMALLLCIAAAPVLIHLFVSGNYGYFNDELYTLACSRHLSLAFVDVPPVAPALLALNSAVFGNSMFALHILPSLFSGAVVVLSGLMARELGGGRKAMLFAGLCAAFVPSWMALGTMYTYDFLDQFMVILLFYAIIRLVKRENPRIWIAIGLIAGNGVMTKPSMVFYIGGIALALLFTKQRKQYLTRWPWLGALTAFVILLPALVWQICNHFPIAEYWTGYSQSQTMHSNPAAFIMMQVLSMNIILLPVWALGLCYFLFNREGGKFRLLGALYCVLIAIFLVLDVKVYMPMPLYAMLIAGGAVALEKFTARKKWRKTLLPAFACIIVLAGALQAPLFMPVLPLGSLVGYMKSVSGVFGLNKVKITNTANVGMPVYFSQRFDWDLLAGDVAGVYNSLPENDRANVTIASQDYGCAGAVDLFGGKLGLPQAACGRLNYYYFSRDNIKAGAWIALGISEDFLAKEFGKVTLAKLSYSEFRSPQTIAIYICREPKFTEEEMKAEFRIVK